jgi:ATP-dependent RNA helicase DDX10/DBP4
VLVKFPSLQDLGKRAFVTYLKSIYLQKDKKVFDLSRFSAEQFAAYAASLGLPVTPKIRFISHKKNVSKKDMEDSDMKQMKSSSKREVIITPKINSDLSVCDGDDDILYPKKPTADTNMDYRLDDVLHPKEPATDTNVTGYVPCNSISKLRGSYLSNLMLPIFNSRLCLSNLC